MISNVLIQTIEASFAARDMRAVRRLLPLLISRCKSDYRLRPLTAELLLRLPEPAAAFRLLSDHEDLDAESRLALANAANFLGASKYGLRVLESVPEKVRQSKRIETGQILSTTFQDREALVYFANMGSPKKPKPAAGEAGEKALLMRCYSLIELEMFDEVFSICDYFLTNEHAAGKHAFALIFAGWASVEKGRSKQAFGFLKRFDNLSGVGESWLHALYHLVAGIAHARSRQAVLAFKHLRQAWKKSFRPGLQPEASWLYVLYWLGRVQFLSRPEEFPIEWKRLLAYPTVTNDFQKKVAAIATFPEGYLLTAGESRKRRATIHINLQDNSVIVAGQPTLGLSVPMRLLGILTSAGPIGVPIFRLFDVLWPEEPLSLRTHLKRLEGLVFQLRKQGLELNWKDNHLWLAPSAKVSVEWNFAANGRAEISDNHFLSQNREFKRADVEEYFGVSNRTAKRHCQRWIKAGLIRLKGRGQKTSYICVSPTM